ncbi:ABC transporter ATP-binding protein [Mangrovibacterium lignilyticum]|uniref:ABC transporter ATP-binding protein n=1 Tax=Mangrovibacterium lignilyticum TaxID=2668052 RepID=UPI0013D677F2|nr:ABC transporter ATP-binding protein [Mangrovibacterium lignilyticum]
MNQIEASHINLHYGKQKILNNVDVSIRAGTITAIVGPNGAGKSSTFRILAGLVHPDSGQVSCNGVNLNHFSELRNYCSYLLESPDFYAYLSGIRNLKLLLRLSGSSADATRLLRLVGLEKDATKKVQHYSRGMKQRLGLAQALADDKPFLVLDEPFNGLDPEVKVQMLQLLFDLKQQGKGILVSTHLLEDIEAIADDFVLLNRGRVYLTGSMQHERENRQMVRFWFSDEADLPENEFPGLQFKGNCWQMQASINESEQLLQKMVAKGLVPYRVERSSLLYDKYMEIAHDSFNSI